MKGWGFPSSLLQQVGLHRPPQHCSSSRQRAGYPEGWEGLRGRQRVQPGIPEVHPSLAHHGDSRGEHQPARARAEDIGPKSSTRGPVSLPRFLYGEASQTSCKNSYSSKRVKSALRMGWNIPHMEFEKMISLMSQPRHSSCAATNGSWVGQPLGTRYCCRTSGLLLGTRSPTLKSSSPRVLCCLHGRSSTGRSGPGNAERKAAIGMWRPGKESMHFGSDAVTCDWDGSGTSSLSVRGRILSQADLAVLSLGLWHRQTRESMQ